MNIQASPKYYLLDAILKYCTDNGLTPIITVATFISGINLNREMKVDKYIKIGIGGDSNKDLVLTKEKLSFFSIGLNKLINIPMEAIIAVKAEENNVGVEFATETFLETLFKDNDEKKTPHLRIVK
jgi:stringent starvation protein B